MSQTDMPSGLSLPHSSHYGEIVATSGTFAILENTALQHSLFEIFEAFVPVISGHLQTLRPDLTALSPNASIASDLASDGHLPESLPSRQVS